MLKSFRLVSIILAVLLPFISLGQADRHLVGLWNSWERISDLPFSPRDGVGVINFKNEIWMLGGWVYGPTTNEIYKSSDGINWELSDKGNWPARHCAGMVAFQDKMWVISGDGYSDVWSSEDGVKWKKEVENAPWGQRYAPYVLAFAGKIWLMGGVSWWDDDGFYHPNNEQVFNDVWSSVDGSNWVQETDSASWGPRGIIHGSVVFNNEMYIIGGGSKNGNVTTLIYNDVWKSKNGVEWELVTEKAPWNPRIHLTTIAFDDKIWVIDGTTTKENLTNEVWYSEDGKEWNQQNSVTKFPRTHASTVFVHDNVLYMSAGFDIDAIYRYQPAKEQHYLGDTLISSILTIAPPPLNLLLSSGLQASYFIEDSTIAEIKDGNLLFKKTGKTGLIVHHPGTYGFYPLDSTYIELTVQKDYLVNSDPSITGTFGDDPLSLDLTLASGLTPSVFIEDSSVVEYHEGELLVKNAGATRLGLVNEVALLKNQLIDTVFIDILINKLGQEIIVEDYPSEVMMLDTIHLESKINSGLPVKIVSNNNIEVINSHSFLSKKSGTISVELAQEGNRNYNESSKTISVFVRPLNENDAIVFPNPARNVLNVFLPDDSHGVNKFILSSLNGKTIKSFLINEPENNLHKLDVSNLTVGVYILQYVSGGKLSSFKIVKND